MQVHPHEKTKRKDFINLTIDELNEARESEGAWRGVDFMVISKIL